ncbi:hypothetical protein [uncultured Erythrobacter sp.]|uniref:hypothetical protein n=1 Tax=uncultured Erythrobacter sp. TaxID=263913 RepID=UPI00262B8CE1|nr:hypothetical protein [uncultured Erythrobacter sp.]
MLSEFAIVMSPVSVMLAGAVACAAYAVHAYRPSPSENDALAGLFQREDFESQLREAALLSSHARPPRRTARDRSQENTETREHMLHQIAAVMRGSERDAEVVRETAHYLAGEGFVIIESRAAAITPDDTGEIIPIGDFEEVKLLPPPSPAKAA